MISIVESNDEGTREKTEGEFIWIYSKNSESLEDDKEYKGFLKKMYLGGHSSFLVVNKEEEYILKKYNKN
jgi:hypothetical protein